MDALGRLFNIVPAVVPFDGNAASTGKRVSLKNAGGCTIVVYSGVGGASEPLTFDVQEHDAASSGTSQDLDVVTTVYKISETTLDADEVWTKVTQTAASEVIEATADSDLQKIYVVEIDASQLSDGFEYLSVNLTDPGVAQPVAALYLVRDLHMQSAPESMAAPNA